VRRDHPSELGRYSVLVVDDHELFSTSLVVALRSYGVNAEQVGTVSMQAILAAANGHPVGLVVLDLNLGRDASGHWLNGHDVLEGLRGARGWKVLIVSGSSHEHQIAAAIAAGAIGFVSKSASFDALLHTVFSAAAGTAVLSEEEHRTWLQLHRSHVAQERDLALKFERLSNRERAVLDMLAEGHQAATIAEQFVVSLTTVRSQIHSVLSKLGVKSQLKAVALIRKHRDDGRDSILR
jgi:DNA-binding NarL/FixJ family response regulator